MKAYKYDYDFSQFDSEHDRNITDTSLLNNRYGFLAQDLKEFLPELVHFDSTSSTYGIDYIGLIPILAGAIQEQVSTIEELEARIDKFEEKEEKSSYSINEIMTESSLGQNIPNPFDEDTFIPFYLEENVKTAVFYVYDLQGKQILARKIIERNSGEILIYGSELQPGMYNYALIADGQIIGTKQMILTK